ncbi:MAG TPA: hypothetical protein VLA91_07865 [Acidimicrobiia bacterium]|nr:hypothetical protein [Acidimicrobiia bacterium]
MHPTSKRHLPQGLLLVLVASVLAELFLLRTATRTLIHIPGIGDIETPIRIVAEAGRFAYYLAVVSVTVTLAILGFRHVRSAVPRRVIAGVGTLAFLLIAAVGRLGGVTPRTAGWITLAVLVAVTSMRWRGLSSIPVGLFVLGSVAAGWSSLGQVGGSGLTGAQVDILVLAAESLLVLAGATAPLLLGRPPTRPALVAGAGAAVLVAAAFAGGASTFSIMVLWNLGVPGWLPGIAFALAFGGIVTAVWSAMASGDRVTAIGIVLLLGGGVGLISTYQTGLALAAILLLAEPLTVGQEQTVEVGTTADYALAGSPPT